MKANRVMHWKVERSGYRGVGKRVDFARAEVYEVARGKAL